MTAIRPLLRRLCAVAVTGALLSCGSDSPTDIVDDPIAVVTIAPASDSIDIEGSITLTATVRTQRGAYVTNATAITWTSLSTAVAGVTGNGATATVTGVAGGTAEIQATAGGVTGSATVTVNSNPPSDEVSTSVAVVNVDFMSSVAAGADTVYVGDDGIFSTAGGTYWNPADSFTNVVDADDEFGNTTTVGLVVHVTGGTFIGAADNELQDNGISSAGLPEHGFRWEGLVADSVYDLAFYVYAEVVLLAETTFDITHAGGKTSLGPNDEPTWRLPGEADKDYLLLEGVSPFEITPGVYGFLIDNINAEGVIMGVQLKGPVTSR
jgi:hypothetical protein